MVLKSDRQSFSLWPVVGYAFPVASALHTQMTCFKMTRPSTLATMARMAAPSESLDRVSPAPMVDTCQVEERGTSGTGPSKPSAVQMRGRKGATTAHWISRRAKRLGSKPVVTNSGVVVGRRALTTRRSCGFLLASKHAEVADPNPRSSRASVRGRTMCFVGWSPHTPSAASSVR